jgi:hypothetical protein
MKKPVRILCTALAAILLLGVQSCSRNTPDPSVTEFKSLMGGMALGVCHPYDDPYNLSLLKEGNIGWIRIDIPWDGPIQVDADGNPVLDEDGRFIETGRYLEFKEKCRFFRENGIKVMAITPYPDDWLDVVGELEMFRSGGEAFSEKFLRMVDARCSYLATDLTAGDKLVNCFQISNELTVQKWQGALTLEQVCQYQDVQMKAMHGICRSAGVPIGYNVVCIGKKMLDYPLMMQRFAEDFDYVALDLYLGCFEGMTKSTKLFDATLRALWKISHKPIMLNEFGYISTGSPKDAGQRAAYLKETFGEEFSTEEKIKADIGPFLDKWESIVGKESSLVREARRKLLTDGPEAAVAYVFSSSEISHLYKALPEGYRLRKFDHTEEGQAAFYTDVIDRISQLDFLCGIFCYCYSDSDSCYQCGQKGCPVETGWGLVSIPKGTPDEEMNENTVRRKPSYYAVRDAYGRILERQK